MNQIESWRKYEARYRLSGCSCDICGKNFYGKKFVCECGSKKLSKIYFEGAGKLVSFTFLSDVNTKFFGKLPYVLGLIELDEGARLVANLTDVSLDDLKIGRRVISVFRKCFVEGAHSVINYGFKFKIVG